MSAGTIEIRFKFNFPVILIAVLLAHALFLTVSGSIPRLDQIISDAQKQGGAHAPIPLNIREIRTVGSPLSKIKNSTYLSKSDRPSKEIAPQKLGEAPAPIISNVTRPANAGGGGSKSAHASQAKPHHPLSLQDLAAPTQTKVADAPKKTVRPGTRPEVAPPEKKAISAISLKGKEIREFMRDSGGSGAATMASAAQLSGDPRARSLNNSDILVNLEVPEGVNPDELNKYELMFYGFQRRTAINYVNAFYKNLDKFQRENPHLQFPLTEGKQIMTGRLTYDEKGNVKQIKMIRWTNVDRLQGFFEEVLKDMDTLHNPPKPLWSKSGEFSIFFSLVING